MQIIIVLVVIVMACIYAGIFTKERKQTQHIEATEINDLKVSTKEDPKTETISDMTDKHLEEKKGTRDLFLETLTQIGCQYEVGEGDNGDITFAYQGEYFLVRTSNSIRFVHIYDTHWGHIELYDIDEISRLKKAINESNLENSVTAVYTVDKAGGTIDVHCKSVILFIQEIPDISEYLRLELNEFFRVHEKINLEMAKQRELEAEK